MKALIPISEAEKYFYESLSKQVEREDNLVNIRLTWMLTTQGFLFTALAIIGDAGNEKGQMYDILKFLLPFTGILLSLIGHIGVKAANMALKELKDRWTPELDQKFVRPFGDQKASDIGKLTSHYLPIVLGFVWLAILIAIIIVPFFNPASNPSN